MRILDELERRGERLPKNCHFSGLNKPMRMEVSLRNLPVEGVIPPEVSGAFFRAVPDPAHPPMFDDDIVLSGDGMVARFLIEDGHVDYDIRYVRTARYVAEREARRALFGQYRNPFTDDPSVEHVDRTVANTTPVWHAGRLLMTKEDGRPYEINPHTLETIGSWDFDGLLRSETVTAHPRIDPVTGEMFFFGYEAGGVCDPHISYCVADRDGNLISEQWFKQPYLSTVHDFCITERFALFPIFPTTTDLTRHKAGGPKWAHEQDLESWLGIMPRYGNPKELRWIKGPPGVSAFHMMNAYDDGDHVHMDVCLSDTNAFPFMREAGGIMRDQREVGGGLLRWTVNLAESDPVIQSRPLGPPGDMPRIRDADQGRPYRAAWYCSINPEGGPPLPGGPVGVAFNLLLRTEPGNGRLDAMPMEPGWGLNEPVHVPSSIEGHEGWLLFVADHGVSDSVHESELWIIDAGDIGKGPVARAKVPLQLRSQVHGTWVAKAELDLAKRQP